MLMSSVQIYNQDIGSLDARVAADLDVEGGRFYNHIKELTLWPSGERMTGCLDELMEKANEMGLDECWDEVSDDDKAVLEPMFRWNTLLLADTVFLLRGCKMSSLKMCVFLTRARNCEHKCDGQYSCYLECWCDSDHIFELTLFLHRSAASAYCFRETMG